MLSDVQLDTIHVDMAYVIRSRLINEDSVVSNEEVLGCCLLACQHLVLEQLFCPRSGSRSVVYSKLLIAMYRFRDGNILWRGLNYEIENASTS